MKNISYCFISLLALSSLSGCSQEANTNQPNMQQTANSIKDTDLCADDERKINELNNKIDILTEEIRSLTVNNQENNMEACISSSLSKQIVELLAKVEQSLPSNKASLPDKNITDVLSTFNSKLNGMNKNNIPLKDVTELSREFDAFIVGINNDDRDKYLEDLSAIDWSIRALTTLVQYKEQTPNISYLIDIMNLAGASTQKSPEWIVKLVNQINSSKKAEWLNWATDPDNKNNIPSSEIEMAIVKLDISELSRNKLMTALLYQQISRIELLDDYRIQKSLAENVYDSALKIRFSLETISDKENVEPSLRTIENVIGKSDTILNKVESVKLKEESFKIRQYQGWTLKQIDLFLVDTYPNVLADINSKFESFKDANTMIEWRLLSEYPVFLSEIEKLIGSRLKYKGQLSADEQRNIYGKVSKYIGWKNDTDLAQLVVREAMVKYLLPVDDRFLVPAVGKYFAKQYDDALMSLEGTDSYIYVLKKTVDVEKVLPSDI